ncbi:hypothetical protein P691DRAFT_768336 [Macrolepiota fuliginosa MF-IS2]|uniref:Uncharacterized protein n=1 Tax=Macrolepiota fuliginosa MF-IS2 TaxID=1400762 RepID=A0A9P5WYH5_9AGAR|nr:hypothetical protein P691DRAFT_768336 [Macrolepiota fuliginosa MF-IS2]
MPCKPKSKLADNVMTTPAFKPSEATQHFLTMMNQDYHVASSFTISEYSALVPPAWRAVVIDNLLHMQFKLADPSTAPNSSTPIEVDDNNGNKPSDDELSPAEELTNSIATFRLWFESNNIADDHLTAVPFPLHAFIHTKTTPHLIAIFMQMTFHHPCLVEAAVQTPAPFHEVVTPPPPPAAVASIPPAGPCGHASYAGAAVLRLTWSIAVKPVQGLRISVVIQLASIKEPSLGMLLSLARTLNRYS